MIPGQRIFLSLFFMKTIRVLISWKMMFFRKNSTIFICRRLDETSITEIPAFIFSNNKKLENL